MLTGQPVKSVEDAKKAVLSLLDMGCRAAIVTLGDQGAVLATTTDRLPLHVPARKVKAIDTTVCVLTHVSSVSTMHVHGVMSTWCCLVFT